MRKRGAYRCVCLLVMGLDIAHWRTSWLLLCHSSITQGMCIVSNCLVQAVAPWFPVLQQPGLLQLFQCFDWLLGHRQGCFPRKALGLRRKDGQSAQSGMSLQTELLVTNSNGSMQAERYGLCKTERFFLWCGWP